ncbi:hypothetical protein [Clostridium tagluense]|uniref:hypothetical protein n=1 Tax=Clostridium tagluense TaxID=360422 RepID=UPI001C6E281B|nr:hypothetical protein [Clostridium tagluense]MBW9158497.1 hypothetical protein [Clostridium tagluense]WLC67357.1 hypothetical protein KTC93_09335 [Clostridium tagluense]
MVKEKKQRGIWLTSTLLVLIVLYSLGILNNLYISSIEPGGLMNSYVLGTMILALIQLIGLILIFKWKKLGAYLYIGVCLTSIVTGFITSSSFILGAIMNMVVYLIISLILCYLICPMWDSME